MSIETAWKRKKARPEWWLRDEESARKGEVRTEQATFAGVQVNPDYPELGRVAMFSSERNGKRYDLSPRLVPKAVRPGDRVVLTILGCCSIIDINGLDEIVKAQEKKGRKTKKAKVNVVDKKPSKKKTKKA